MTNRTEFKRLNFFTGFFTTATDWEEGQNYHLEKLKLHNRWLHNTPGIVRDEGDKLRVEAAGGLKVRVLPGGALDGLGREIYLVESYVLDLGDGLDPSQGDSARKVYIVIEYDEEKIDYVENVEQPQYSGHTRIAEHPRLRTTLDEPDNHSQLELARINLEAGATEIVDSQDPDNPKANEIDRRHVCWSVSVAQQQKQSADLQERLIQEEEKSTDFQERLGQLNRHRRLHNRGLHAPGVIPGEAGELRVEAVSGLDVRVEPGAALDGDGSSIILEETHILGIDPGVYKLPQLVYMAIRYEDGLTDGFETVRLQVTTTKPDNHTWMELARIDLQPGVEEIVDPEDPDNPKGNEINHRHVLRAGAVGVAEEQMSPETLQHLIQVMGRTRRDFAALDDRFPVPSASDVRHAALTVETLARIARLRPGQLPDLLATIAAIEQDVGQEIYEKYGNVVNTTGEFHEYQTAVQDLQAALRLGEERNILTAQDAVAEAARELSEIAVESPIADAGRDQTVTTLEDEATVTLDATHSHARGGREIVRYRWETK